MTPSQVYPNTCHNLLKPLPERPSTCHTIIPRCTFLPLSGVGTGLPYLSQNRGIKLRGLLWAASENDIQNQTVLNVFARSMGTPERARPKNGSAQVDANDRPEPWRKNECHAAWERSCARRNERHAAWERFSSPHGPFLPPKGERRILENKAPERQSGKTSPPHAAWERDFLKIYRKT